MRLGANRPGVAREDEARTRDFGFRHLPVEAEIAGERLELKRVTPAGEKLAQAQHHTDGDGGVRVRRGRVEAFSS